MSRLLQVDAIDLNFGFGSFLKSMRELLSNELIFNVLCALMKPSVALSSAGSISLIIYIPLLHYGSLDPELLFKV